MIKWVLDRAEGKGKATETFIGSVPTLDAIETDGVVPPENLQRLLRVDPAEWVEAVAAQEDFFNQFGDRLPVEMREEHERLARAVGEGIATPDVRSRAVAEH